MTGPGASPPRLRPATDDDNRDVIGLIGACWSEYPGCVMDVHGECPDLLAPASAYRRQGGGFWVGVDPCGTVVATVGWRPLTPGAIELERLYVNHRWRRKGVAAQLAGLVEADGRRARRHPGGVVERLAVHRRPPVLRAAGLQPRRPGPGVGRSQPNPRTPLREDPVVDRSPRHRAGGGVGSSRWPVPPLAGPGCLRWPGGAVSAGRAGRSPLAGRGGCPPAGRGLAGHPASCPGGAGARRRGEVWRVIRRLVRAGQVTRGLTSQAGPSARSAAAMSLIRSTAS